MKYTTKRQLLVNYFEESTYFYHFDDIIPQRVDLEDTDVWENFKHIDYFFIYNPQLKEPWQRIIMPESFYDLVRWDHFNRDDCFCEICFDENGKSICIVYHKSQEESRQGKRFEGEDYARQATIDD